MTGGVKISHDRWPSLGLLRHINGTHIHAQELCLRIAKQMAGCFVYGDDPARPLRRDFVNVYIGVEAFSNSKR